MFFLCDLQLKLFFLTRVYVILTLSFCCFIYLFTYFEAGSGHVALTDLALTMQTTPQLSQNYQNSHKVSLSSLCSFFFHQIHTCSVSVCLIKQSSSSSKYGSWALAGLSVPFRGLHGPNCFQSQSRAFTQTDYIAICSNGLEALEGKIFHLYRTEQSHYSPYHTLAVKKELAPFRIFSLHK